MGQFAVPMIVFAIKSFFFSGADSYSLERKPHMSYFFIFFYGKMIKVVYAIFAVAIENLKVCLGNLNLLLRKSTIQFELSAYKKETGKQMAGIPYYQY